MLPSLRFIVWGVFVHFLLHKKCIFITITKQHIMKTFYYYYKSGKIGGFGTVEAENSTRAKFEVIKYINHVYKRRLAFKLTLGIVK